MSTSKRIPILIFFGLLIIIPAGLALAQAPAAKDITTYNNTVWSYVQRTSGVVTVWKVSLSLVDLVVVGGLLVAAFANIFRFRIDLYGVKQILPGLIIGIILANLSFFIMRLFIESATIFTQFLGTIVQGYAGGTLGDQQVGIYLARRAQELLYNSMWALPGLAGYAAGTATGAAAGGITAGIFFGAGLPVLIGVVGGVVILAFLVLTLTFLPILLFLILLFLLYIRNYVLIALFMVSPLAFFSLGFPPLRKYWQLWWGSFWKWLLMPMASFAIIGFMVIFLNAANVAEKGTYRNYLDYFFFNGIAFLLLFAANRVPFMWGSLFGQNVMGRWAGLGNLAATGIKETARAGGDKAWQKGAAAYGNRKAGPAPIIAAPANYSERRALIERGHKLGVKKESGESPDEYIARVAEAERKSTAERFAGNFNRWNPIRGASGIRQGYAERIKYWNETKARQARQTGYFPELAGREQSIRFYTTDNAQRYQSIESFDEAMENVARLNKGRLGDAQLRGLVRSGFTDKADPTKDWGKLSSEEVADLGLAMRAAQRLGRQGRRTPPLTDAISYMTRTYGHLLPSGVTQWSPGVIGADGNEIKFDAAGFSASRPRPGSRRGTPHAGDQDVNELNQTSGSTTTIINNTNTVPEVGKKAGAAGTAINPGPVGGAQYIDALEKLTAVSSQVRIPDRVLDKVIARVRKRIDTGAGGAITARELGVSKEQFSAIKEPLSRYITERKSFGGTIDKESTLGEAHVEKLNTAGVLAKHIAENQPTQIDSLRGELDSYISDLTKGVNNQRLGEIQAGLSKIHPAAGVTPTSGDPSEVQSRLLESARNSRDAVSLLSEQTMKQALAEGQPVDKALDQTVRVRKMKDQISLDMVNHMDETLQGSGQITTEDINNPELLQSLGTNIRHLMEYHPILHENLEGITLEQQQAIANAVAEQFSQQVAQTVSDKAKSQPEGAAVEPAIRDENGQEAIGNTLEKLVLDKINEVKAQLPPPPAEEAPAPEAATSPEAPAQADTTAAQPAAPQPQPQVEQPPPPAA